MDSAGRCCGWNGTARFLWLGGHGGDVAVCGRRGMEDEVHFSFTVC
jgi:hypothetical protein